MDKDMFTPFFAKRFLQLLGYLSYFKRRCCVFILPFITKTKQLEGNWFELDVMKLVWSSVAVKTREMTQKQPMKLSQVRRVSGGTRLS